MTPVSKAADLCKLAFGNPAQPDYLYVRTGQADQRPEIDHVAFSVKEFKTRPAYVELQRRGLHPVYDPPDSWDVNSPGGLMVQIGKKNPALTAGAGTRLAPDRATLKAIGAILILNTPAFSDSEHFYSSLLGINETFVVRDHANPSCLLRFGPNDGVYITKCEQRCLPPRFGVVVEKYDHAEVKAELERYGVNFRPASASAVVVEDPAGTWLAVMGPQALQRMRSKTLSAINSALTHP